MNKNNQIKKATTTKIITIIAFITITIYNIHIIIAILQIVFTTTYNKISKTVPFITRALSQITTPSQKLQPK